MRPPVDPKLDAVFKLLFARPENRNLLVSLLTAVLCPPEPIVDVTVLDPELPKDLADDKGAWLDVLVRLEDGRQVDVEMQSCSRPDLRQRALFYWSRLYSGQIGRGVPHSALQAAVSVFILAFRDLPGPRFHSKFRVLEVRSHEPFSEHLELHVVELPKLDDLAGDLEEADLVRWGRFLAAETAEDREELAMQDPVMKEAKEALDRLSDDPAVQELAQRRKYEQYFYQHELQVMREEGEATGHTKGHAEGRAEGRVEVQRSMVGRMCEVLGIELDEQKRQAVAGMSDAELEALLDALTRERRWPAP